MQIQFDPFAYFNFPLPATAGSPATTSVGAVDAYLGAWGHTALVGFSFDEDLTPYVEHISTSNGTTAGGTTVRLFTVCCSNHSPAPYFPQALHAVLFL